MRRSDDDAIWTGVPPDTLPALLTSGKSNNETKGTVVPDAAFVPGQSIQLRQETMPARAYWKGYLRLSLVTIGIEL
jgi:hypothetical protein